MLYRLIIPGTLEDCREVRLLEWHGAAGALLQPGNLILELETHKAVIEVRADQNGYLRQRLSKEGDWRPLQATLAILSDGPDEPIPADTGELEIISARFSIG